MFCWWPTKTRPNTACAYLWWWLWTVLVLWCCSSLYGWTHCTVAQVPNLAACRMSLAFSSCWLCHHYQPFSGTYGTISEYKQRNHHYVLFMSPLLSFFWNTRDNQWEQTKKSRIFHSIRGTASSPYYGRPAPSHQKKSSQGPTPPGRMFPGQIWISDLLEQADLWQKKGIFSHEL